MYYIFCSSSSRFLLVLNQLSGGLENIASRTLENIVLIRSAQPHSCLHPSLCGEVAFTKKLLNSSCALLKASGYDKRPINLGTVVQICFYGLDNA